MSERFPHLLAPGRLGRHEIRNRVWMAAHATLLVKDNLFTDEHIHYYLERARGGVGIITMEAIAVHPTTQPYKGKGFAFDPRIVPQYRRIAEAVHAHGAKILTQPWHRGRQTGSVANGLPVWAPSAVPCSVYREMPHAMTGDDIRAIVEGYRLSARYALEGGLDGVEVQGTCHGYLLNQFLSPATNHRTDAYGGSLENRMRIVLEALEATREETGPDLIVGIRINGDDGHPGGLRPDDWTEIARRLAATGLLDYVSVSQGTYLNRMLIYPTSPEEHGYQMAATRQIRAAIDIPVVGAGRIVRPEEAERHLADGDCDYVALARALIADPDWVAKAARGEPERVRPCVGANWCMSSIAAQAPIACIHNPAAGRETRLGGATLAPAATRRRVAVVGGGPAGMRAALTAASRGHAVTLFEKAPRLGGQIDWWRRIPSRAEHVAIADWLEAQLRDAPVAVETGREVDAAALADGFDGVVVATGAVGVRHGWTLLHPERWEGAAPLPGSEQPNVWSYTDVLAEAPELGPSVLLFDGMGGAQGAATAEFLAARGHRVEFATQLGQPSPDLAASRDWGKIHGRLRRLGVRFTVDVDLVRIDGRTVEMVDLYTREPVVREDVDAVVLLLGAVAQDSLFHALAPRRGPDFALHLVGDAMAPRRVADAIREGEEAARAL